MDIDRIILEGIDNWAKKKKLLAQSLQDYNVKDEIAVTTTTRQTSLLNLEI